MNNIQKFNETQKALRNFQKQTNYLEEQAQEKLEKKGAFSKDYFNVLARKPMSLYEKVILTSKTQ